MKKRPDIVIFHCHDLGRWIEPYGYPVPTPNLARFASEAVVFRKAFCAAPTCSPSRAAMLTSMAPHQVNMLGLAHRGFGPVDESKHLVNFLKAHGCHTMLFGVQHETVEEGIPALGYTEHFVPEFLRDFPGDYDRRVSEGFAARMREPLPEEPLFISYGSFMPHRLFPAPGLEDDPNRLVPPFPVSDTPEARADFAAFRAATRIADESFGRMLEALDAAGRLENTIMLVTTDHGPAFPGMKCTLHDTGIGVALMLRVPGVKAGVNDALVSHMDVFPTLCELAGLEPPPWLQGHSLVPLIDNPRTSVREELFAEVSYHGAYEPMRCIRTQRHKLIRHFDPDRLRPLPANVDEGPERERLLGAGWQNLARDPVELYDLAVDPFETRNLADDPAFRDVRDELWARLEQWMRETSDPLAVSAPRIPAPPGATVNRKECVSVHEENFE